MLIPIMDVSRLIVHSKQIEGQKLKQVGRDLKRTGAEDGNSSKARLEVQDKPRLKKRFSNQGPINAPIVRQGKVSTPKPQDGKVVVLMLRNLFVQSVVENMMASA